MGEQAYHALFVICYATHAVVYFLRSIGFARRGIKPLSTQQKRSMWSVKSLCFSAIVAALYAAITLLFQPLSFGAIQIRFSEALTLLPVLFPQAIPGLALGCFVSNLIGGFGPWDMLLGTLATLLAALTTWRLRGKSIWLCALPPVLFNAIIIGVMLYCLGIVPLSALFISMLSIGGGEAVTCYALGIPLVRALSHAPIGQWLGK